MSRDREKLLREELIGPERTREGGDGTEQDVLRIRVWYEEGGSNWFHGTTNERGYYLGVTPETIETTAEGFKMRRTRLGSGLKKLLLAAKRFSAKKLEEVAREAGQNPELVAKITTLVKAEEAAQSGKTQNPASLA